MDQSLVGRFRRNNVGTVNKPWQEEKIIREISSMRYDICNVVSLCLRQRAFYLLLDFTVSALNRTN